MKLSLVASFACLLGSLPALATPKSADMTAKFVYVESNIALPHANSILAFRRGTDGKLMPLPGSPFLTGGKGVVDPTYALGPFDSDQNIMMSEDHRFLFAVNSGSNTIAVFQVHADGSLKAVQGSPFASWGINPVSVGIRDHVLFVVNKHGDPAQMTDKSMPNYTSFWIHPDGSLAHIPYSTVDVAAGASPSQALTTHMGPFVFGADFLGGLLESLTIDRFGQLEAHQSLMLPNSEFTGTDAPHAPLGLALHPKEWLLYVGFPTVSKLGVYKFDASGRLTFIRTTGNSGKAICWLRVNKAGTRLYTSNSADHTLSVYDIGTAPDDPREIQHIALKGVGAPFQLMLDPSGDQLYVTTERDSASIPHGMGNAIQTLKVNADGSLSQNDDVMNIALPGDMRIQGLAVF